jgi:hypothetical protein
MSLQISREPIEQETMPINAIKLIPLKTILIEDVGIVIFRDDLREPFFSSSAAADK